MNKNVNIEDVKNAAKRLDIWNATAASYLCELLDISEDGLLVLLDPKNDFADSNTKTPEEFVDNYVKEYAGNSDDAYLAWMENHIHDYNMQMSSGVDNQYTLVAQVTRLLGALSESMTITNIEWDIPEGKAVSNKLTEWKIVPLPSREELAYMSHEELETRIIGCIKSSFGFIPKKFSYISPLDQLPMQYALKMNKTNKPLTADEIRCFWDEQAMFIEWNDGSDSLCQENGYTLQRVLEIVDNAEGNVYFDGYDPASDPEYLKKVDDFRVTHPRAPIAEITQDWLIGISGSELNDVNIIKIKGTKSQIKRYLVTMVNTDRHSDEPDSWDHGTESILDVIENKNGDGSLTACGYYVDYHMTYTAWPDNKVQQLSL